MAEKIDVTMKFVISSGNSARIANEEVAMVANARIGELVNAIKEEFGNDLQISANQDLVMYVQAPTNLSLEQLGIENGDTIMFLAGSGGRLVTRRGK